MYKNKLKNLHLTYEKYKKEGKGTIKFKFSDGQTTVATFKEIEEFNNEEQQNGGSILPGGSPLFQSSKSPKSPKSPKSSSNKFGDKLRSTFGSTTSTFAKNLSSDLVKQNLERRRDNFSRNIRSTLKGVSAENQIPAEVLATNQQMVSEIRDMKTSITEKMELPLNKQIDTVNNFISKFDAVQLDEKEKFAELLSNLSKISIVSDELSTKIS